MSVNKIILGIDPGSRVAGFGALCLGPDRSIRLLTYGVIAPPRGLEFNHRIAIVSEEMEALLARLKPDVTVVEKVFFGKNADSAFKLGQARGATIAAIVRAQSSIVEYATRAVKKGITGIGSATKEQVQQVLFSHFSLPTESASLDASDALALAYHHAKQLEIQKRIPDKRGGAKELEL